MSHAYSAWVGQTNASEAFEYQLSPRSTSYLIEIDGKFVKVRVPEAPAEAPADDEDAKKPLQKPVLPHAEVAGRSSGRTA